jgi:hypothetical protein
MKLNFIELCNKWNSRALDKQTLGRIDTIRLRRDQLFGVYSCGTVIGKRSQWFSGWIEKGAIDFLDIWTGYWIHSKNFKLLERLWNYFKNVNFAGRGSNKSA